MGNTTAIHLARANAEAALGVGERRRGAAGELQRLRKTKSSESENMNNART